MKYWDLSVFLRQKLYVFATQQIPVLATFPILFHSDPQFFTRLEEAPHNFFAKLGVTAGKMVRQSPNEILLLFLCFLFFWHDYWTTMAKLERKHLMSL